MNRIASTLLGRLTLAIPLFASIATTGGCVATTEFVSSVSNWSLVKAKERQDLGEIRRDTRDELAEQRQLALQAAYERDLAEARLAAQRQMLEAEMCRANQEAANERIRSNIKETVESKLAFNLQQGLEVGELEVDTEQLQALLKEREEARQKPPPMEEGKERPPCSCCDQECGCEPGMRRRHCPRCRRKPCEAEKKCGGPETVAAMEEARAKQPLRPAEIPLKLPVRLSFGMQNPTLEESRIKRQPGIEIEEGKQRCPNGCCPGGRCLDPSRPCIDGRPPQDASSTRRLAPPSVDVIDIPKPEPDNEVRAPLRPTYLPASYPPAASYYGPPGAFPPR